MKVKTSELTGAALDWAVAKIEYKGEHCYPKVDLPRFSSEWYAGGPIIEREKIAIQGYEDGTWTAVTSLVGASYYHHGETPLIAAMRCYVTSKLGNEIEIPQELL